MSRETGRKVGGRKDEATVGTKKLSKDRLRIKCVKIKNMLCSLLFWCSIVSECSFRPHPTHQSAMALCQTRVSTPSHIDPVSHQVHFMF
eukprot:7299316-Alexandrium_andersonii.AAC.1